MLLKLRYHKYIKKIYKNFVKIIKILHTVFHIQELFIQKARKIVLQCSFNISMFQYTIEYT